MSGDTMKLTAEWPCGLKQYHIVGDGSLAHSAGLLTYWHQYRHSKRFKKGDTYQDFLERNPDFRPEKCACDEPVV